MLERGDAWIPDLLRKSLPADQAHGWVDMDTDTGRVASVMQNPPPPSGEAQQVARVLRRRRRRRAEQKLELALGRLRPATAGKRKDEVEMGCGGECTMCADGGDGGW